MLNKKIAAILFTGIGMFVSYAQIASSACADPSEYEIIAPFGTLSGCVGLTEYLDKLMQTVIGIAGILAVFMIVWCGIKLMTAGSAGGKSEAKECITNAILGLLLAVGSFLILNTINPLLLKDAPAAPPDITGVVPSPPGAAVIQPFPTDAGWYFRYVDSQGNTVNTPKYATQQLCAAQLKAQVDAGVTIKPSPQGKNECFQVFSVAQPENADEAAVRKALCGNDSCVNQKPIGINNSPCPYDGYEGSCTNVKGLLNSAVTAIQQLQQACNCNVMVTGGTEYWKHAQAGTGSHKPGDGVFDLRWDGDTTALANTIKSGNAPKASFSGNTRWLYNGFWYTDEKSAELHGGKRHWHACPVGASPSYCN